MNTGSSSRENQSSPKLTLPSRLFGCGRNQTSRNMPVT